MIKINLALRKQSPTLAGAKGAKAGKGGALFKFDMDSLKDLPVRKYVAAILTCLIANYTLEVYQEEVLKENQVVLDQVTQENEKVKAQLKDVKKYEDIKKLLETDEKTLRTKIDVIRQLVAQRGAPPKLLMGIAASIPKEAWLTELIVKEDSAAFKGYAMGLGQVSDFMKSLSQNPFFKDLTLKSSNTTRDETGVEAATFELGAKRR